jgi:hypothetical protein
MKTIKNVVNRAATDMIRTSDKYGNLHFISFLGAALSRLAYVDDNKFLKYFCKIMSPAYIHTSLLEGIDNVPENKLGLLLEDQIIFKLNHTNPFSMFTYIYPPKNSTDRSPQKKYIDFMKLDMPHNINNIIQGKSSKNERITHIPGTYTQKRGFSPIPLGVDTVKYISIAWSNYGEVFVVANKNMPKTIFVIFRGTYSSQTFSLYTTPASITPFSTCNGDKFLYGIFKVSTEMIHTIIESIRHLAVNFLGATVGDGNPIKIFSTGHSLGGAMCTIFSYLWMKIKKTEPYNDGEYKVLSDNIICVSLGAPRVFDTVVAKKFCEFTRPIPTPNENPRMDLGRRILYLRITNRGDPVVSAPFKSMGMLKSTGAVTSDGFQHPCSDNEIDRQRVLEDCNAPLLTNNLDCLNYTSRNRVPNMAAHMNYLGISYVTALNPIHFMKGTVFDTEIYRVKYESKKSTVCRLIMGTNSSPFLYKAIFFNVTLARLDQKNKKNIDEKIEDNLEKPTDTPALEKDMGVTATSGGGWSSIFSSNKKQQVSSNADAPVEPKKSMFSKMSMPSMPKMPSLPKMPSTISFTKEIEEDVRMSKEAFENLMNKLAPLNNADYAPLEGVMENPFTDKLMPDISCQLVKSTGGTRKRSHRTSTKKRITRYRHKSQKHKRRSRV